MLEAGRAGWGPSGRNGGFLHGYWSGIGWLRDLVGDAAAVALCRAADGAIPAVRHLGADVWLHEAGMLRVSTTPSQEAAIDRTVAAGRAVGAPEEALALTPSEVRARCHSPRFRRGVFFRDGATVQPARLVLALRSAVLAAGVQLHERSPAAVSYTHLTLPTTERV